MCKINAPGYRHFNFRDLIGYDRHALSDEVRNEMNSDKFSKLSQLNTAHAIANMYKFKDPADNQIREITDDSYLGSLYFYHQQVGRSLVTPKLSLYQSVDQTKFILREFFMLLAASW